MSLVSRCSTVMCRGVTVFDCHVPWCHSVRLSCAVVSQCSTVMCRGVMVFDCHEPTQISFLQCGVFSCFFSFDDDT